MKFLRNLLDRQEKHFHKGGKWEKLFPLFEAIDTFMYTPGQVTQTGSHIRDAMDLKRMMMVVVYALIPTVLMACYNTGLQANLELAARGLTEISGWRGAVLAFLGLGVNPQNILDNAVLGLLYFLPVYIITIAAGGFWEVLFASIRKHEVNEGFLVTSLLFPLILPPTIPWWQVVLGISFGVVIGKEVFGGVGKNILNPALTARVFLFFAYPGEISGDKVWVALDGVSRATPLAQLADPLVSFSGLAASWKDAFLGFIPGSMGETSTLAALIGAFVLIASGVGSWRIMLGCVLGLVGMSGLFNLIGSAGNPMFAVPWYWHIVLGGFAFGAVYMATDPVSATYTDKGKLWYGFFIGVLTVLVRVINPAYPEGVMLAILFMNVFAPLIDRVVLNANIKRRLARNVI